MPAVAEPYIHTLSPTAQESRLAARGARALASVRPRDEAVTLTVTADGDGTELRVPARLLAMVEAILGAMAAGTPVALTPLNREVGTQAAADALNVSRPHLVKLLEGGAIPFRRVGTHRRVRMADLLAYRARMNAGADAAFDDLVAQAQDLDMGYE